MADFWLTKDGMRWKRIEADDEGLEADSMMKFLTVLSDAEYRKVVQKADIVARLENILSLLEKQDLGGMIEECVRLKSDLKAELNMWDSRQ